MSFAHATRPGGMRAAWEETRSTAHLHAPTQAPAIEAFLHKIDSGIYTATEVRECHCGSRELATLCRTERLGLPFASLLCEHCGLVHTSPRLAEKDLPAFYADDYYPICFGSAGTSQSESLTTTNYSPYQGFTIAQICRPFLPTKPDRPLEVVEIGCGCGLNLHQFASAMSDLDIPVHTVGVDYSPEHREEARRTFGVAEAHPDVHTLAQSKGQLRADILILSHVLEHFSDLPGWLDRLAELVRPGGLLYVEVPGIAHLTDTDVYLFSPDYYFHCSHLYCFSLSSLACHLAFHGFELLQGDEHIRAVFRRGTSPQLAGTAPTGNTDTIRATLDTLARPPYSLLGKALAAGRSGDTDAALQHATRALHIAPELCWTHALLVDVHLRRGNRETVIRHAEQALALNHPEPLPLIAQCALQYIALGYYDSAREQVAAYRARCPQWDMTPVQLEARLARIGGDPDRAVALARTVTSRHLYDPLLALEELRSLLDLRHTTAARCALITLEERFSDNLELQVEHLRLLLQENHMVKATALLETIIERSAPRTRWYLHTCALYLRDYKQHQLALRAVDRALTIVPDCVESARLRGGILATMGRHDEALETFRTLFDTALEPSKAPDLLLNMADVLRYAGRTQESRHTIDRFVELRPNDPAGPRALAKLETC